MKLIRYNGNFVKCKNEIEEAGQRIATASEGMRDRIASGLNSHYKIDGCWHSEGTARIGGINYWCLPKFAPTTNYPEETLKANENSKYLDLTDKKIVSPSGKPFIELIPEIAEKDKDLPPYKRRVLIPKIQETFSHKTRSLDEVDIALFLARKKDLTQNYGNFLNDKCGIPLINFFQIGKSYDNVGAGFWLPWLELGDDSNFGGDYRYFYDGVGSLFGVAKRGALSQRKDSAEPTQKILYSKGQILRALKSAGLTGKVEKLVLSKLR